MAFFDMPLEDLQKYRPPRDEPADFDAFWQQTIAEARQFPLDPRFVAVDYGLETVETFDVTFCGYAGQPIKGWLLLPRNRSGSLPCVVEYIGYGGGRGFPVDWLLWSSAGYAHLVMDTRGQGGAWLRGDTPDIDPGGGSPQSPGFMTRGILQSETYYYRRLITDAVRAVEAARSHTAIDSARIAVAGVSQGGGLALAVGGLLSDISVVLSDVPFLCHYRRATEITDTDPYREITRFCVAQRDMVGKVFETLSYFDGVNFASRVTARALFSVGLMDDVCPPSTVFAAFNYLPGVKEMRVWQYNNHEGGGSHQVLEKLKFLRAAWSER